jgi:glutamate-5-semialdehyde dehydrogenase
MSEFTEYIEKIAKRAREVSYEVASMNTIEKNKALSIVAKNISQNADFIKTENLKDIDYARSIGKSEAIIDRLVLNDKRINGMVTALEDIIALPDPVGGGDYIVKRPNGLQLNKIRVPIGVVAIIYESRPNVTSDASGLTLKSGNTVILRGGKEAVHSNVAITELIRDALKEAGFPEDAVQILDRTEREIVSEMLKLDKYIDVVIPRGGEGLIRAVSEQSSIPVIKHDKGVCHVFVDESADKTFAETITVNAKVQRPSVCNAIETLLIHKNYPYKKELLEALIKENVEIRADKVLRDIIPDLKPATDEDWTTEYLDYIISAKVVDNVDEAINHINTYGSHHSDAIVSENYHNTRRFLDRVDSAAVYANASTRFTDGGEFGLGAEIGISTQKLHVRGPMGLDKLTTEKWVIYGDGHIR